MFNQHDDEFISQDTVSLSQVKVCTSSRHLAIEVKFQTQAADIGDSLYMLKPPYNKSYLSRYCELIVHTERFLRPVWDFITGEGTYMLILTEPPSDGKVSYK